MIQPDDHERARHGAAGFSGPCHARTECACDPECCFAVQTGPPAVDRQDGLGSGKTFKECRQSLVDVIICILIFHEMILKPTIKIVSRRGAENAE
jgi:hypothetical protein